MFLYIVKVRGGILCLLSSSFVSAAIVCHNIPAQGVQEYYVILALLSLISDTIQV